MSYDNRCYDLALAFLDGEPLTKSEYETAAHHLAQRIQNAIESWIEELRIDLAEDLDR